MFVRFRERNSSGREPDFIGAELQCAGRCHPDFRNRRAGPGARYLSGCPLKPHCRWLIAGKPPHRLLVSLIENRRIDGKVRQEHIGDLGAIDGHMLLSFFSEPMPAEWHVMSISTRLAFWNELNERLARLSNRISTEDTVKIRASVQERVPQPTTEDIHQLEAWNAMQEIIEWEKMRGGFQSKIDDGRMMIEHYEDSIKDLRDEIAGLFYPAIEDINDNVRTIQCRLAKGDRSIIEESREVREEIRLGPKLDETDCT
jgi:hypothetical protein